MAAFSPFLVRLLSHPAVCLSDLECNSLSEFDIIAAYAKCVEQFGCRRSGQVVWDVWGTYTASHQHQAVRQSEMAERPTGCFPEGWSVPANATHQPFTANSLFNFLLFSAEQLLLLAEGKGKTRRTRNFVSSPEVCCSIWIARCLAAITVIAKSWRLLIVTLLLATSGRLSISEWRRA